MLPQNKHREERPALALWSPVSTSSHTGYSSQNSAPEVAYPPKDRNNQESRPHILQHTALLAETHTQREVRFDAPVSDMGPSETAIEDPGILGHLFRSDGTPSLGSLLDDKHDESPRQRMLSTTEILRLRTRAMAETENAIEGHQEYDDEQPSPGSPLESAWLRLLQKPRRPYYDEDDSDEDYLFAAAPTSRRTGCQAPPCSIGSTLTELSQPPTPTSPRRHFDVGTCVENQKGGSGDDTPDTDTADEDDAVIIKAQSSHTKYSTKLATGFMNKKSSATSLLKQLLESGPSAQIPATPPPAKPHLDTCPDLPTPIPSDGNPYPPSPTESLEEMFWLAAQTGSVGFYKGRPIVPSPVRDPVQLSFLIRPRE